MFESVDPEEMISPGKGNLSLIEEVKSDGGFGKRKSTIPDASDGDRSKMGSRGSLKLS